MNRRYQHFNTGVATENFFYVKQKGGIRKNRSLLSTTKGHFVCLCNYNYYSLFCFFLDLPGIWVYNLSPTREVPD